MEIKQTKANGRIERLVSDLPVIELCIDSSTAHIDGRRNHSKEMLADATIHFAQSPFVR